MTSFIDHEELSGRAAGYVLGTLDPAEYAQLRAHLAECADCAAAVRAMAPVAESLAYAAPPVGPPEALRGRVLARIQSTDGVEPGRQEADAASRAGQVAAPRRVLPPWLLAAAALVIAVGLGADAVRLRERIGSLEVRLRDVNARADASERELTTVRQAAAEAQTLVVVLTSADLMHVDLVGQPTAPEARARAFWSRSRGLIFTGSDLPPLPAGRTYQLWIVTPEAPVSAGLLRPGERGDVHGVFATPRDVAKVAAVAVTIEPEGGVAAPTGDKYLVGLAN